MISIGQSAAKFLIKEKGSTTNPFAGVDLSKSKLKISFEDNDMV